MISLIHGVLLCADYLDMVRLEAAFQAANFDAVSQDIADMRKEMGMVRSGLDNWVVTQQEDAEQVQVIHTKHLQEQRGAQLARAFCG